MGFMKAQAIEAEEERRLRIRNHAVNCHLPLHECAICQYHNEISNGLDDGLERGDERGN